MTTISKIKVGGTTYDIAYPVGSIYMSVNDTSPAELFGGTWEQLKDRFLLAAGDTYAAGSTGGEAKHVLSIDELPAHNHDIFYEETADQNAPIAKTNYNARVSLLTTAGQKYWTGGTIETGKNSGHNNMPPYLAVYMWKRIA